MNVTAKIRERIDRHPVYQAEDLIERIRPFSCVSFDIFDTLIKRNVPTPKDVFTAVAQRYHNETGAHINARLFQADRTEAERTARSRAKSNSREEPTLDEIYQCLPSIYQAHRDALMDLEIAQEKSCCHSNSVMQTVFQWCKEHQKRIFLISDMYLPYKVIEEILHHSGIDGYDHLFLSVRENTTKRSGGLFSVMLDETGVRPSELIHIGDHLRSDYMQAKRHGIAAVWIARNPKRTKFTRLYLMPPKVRRHYRRLENIMNGCIAPDWTQYYQFGFEALGPLLYGFCTWLHEDAKKRGIEKLFFLSRDGYLMQKAYLLLYGEHALPNYYLYASRKALHTTNIWLEANCNAILSQYSPYKNWNCKSLCDEFGIGIQVGENAWASCGLHKDQNFITKGLIENSSVQRFFATVWNEMVENSKKEYDALLKYLQQCGFQGSCAVIDIGWAGTMQRNLQNILNTVPGNNSIYGYYIGLIGSAPKELRAAPYIPPELYPKLGCAGFLEFLFPAPVGSTKGYKEYKGKVIPVLFPYEYKNKDVEPRVRSEIQSGALEFLGIMRNGVGLDLMDAAVAFTNLRLAGKFPRKQELDMFGALLFMDNELHPLAMPKSLLYYLCHPKQLIQDFLNSRWKCGFAKKLFKLPFPYHWGFAPFEK